MLYCKLHGMGALFVSINSLTADIFGKSRLKNHKRPWKVTAKTTSTLKKKCTQQTSTRIRTCTDLRTAVLVVFFCFEVSLFCLSGGGRSESFIKLCHHLLQNPPPAASACLARWGRCCWRSVCLRAGSWWRLCCRWWFDPSGSAWGCQPCPHWSPRAHWSLRGSCASTGHGHETPASHILVSGTWGRTNQNTPISLKVKYTEIWIEIEYAQVRGICNLTNKISHKHTKAT